MKRKRMMIFGSLSLACAAILLVGLLLVPRAMRNFFYPVASKMPPAVGQSMEDILAKIEREMEVKAPKVLTELQSGLSESEISKHERNAGVTLPDDIKALYRWHNGSATRDPRICGPIPGHRFLPLEEALGSNRMITNQLANAGGAQQAAFNVFAGHTKSWITLFDDGAGDGYFFDPKRKASEGAVFYHFAEDASYVFFPSVKNLLAGALKCYEQSAFAWKTNENGMVLTEDFERSQKIWQEFGASNAEN
jgi:cell wall assembly regulator SMI1